MAADSFVYIGKTHTVCQDHAAAGVTSDGRVNYAVVSDGCSSSTDSEFGSWALVRATLMHLNVERWPENAPGYLSLADILRRAYRMATECWVSKNALDATLLVAIHTDNKITVKAWGDGVIVARTRANTLVVYNIEYKSGAPAYPSYTLDATRSELFYRETEQGRYTLTIHTQGESGWETAAFEHDTTLGEPFEVDFDTAHFDMVGVASDGLNSYQRKTSNGSLAPVTLLEVIPQVFGFKGALTGEYVVRRMRRFQKDMGDLGWQHADDVSVAVLHVPVAIEDAS